MKLYFIYFPVTEIKHGIAIWMVFIQKLGNLVDVVSIELLSARGSWEAHAKHPLCDVSYI